jgi:hypothetical protein
MPLQRSTTGVCHTLLWFPEQNILICSAKVSRTIVPSCTMWSRQFTKYDERYVTKYDAIAHSTKQDTQPIAFLISRQVIPYRTCGGTYCPMGSTPKIQWLADSSTTCHDSINHLHHCSNHNIDPHTANSHLEEWKTTTLSPWHKPAQHHKGWKTSMTHMTAWLSITNQEWTQIPKVWGLVTLLKCAGQYVN